MTKFRYSTNWMGIANLDWYRKEHLADKVLKYFGVEE